MHSRTVNVAGGALLLVVGWLAFGVLHADPNVRRTTESEYDGATNALRDAGRVILPLLCLRTAAETAAMETQVGLPPSRVPCPPM